MAANKRPSKHATKNLPPKKPVKGGAPRTGWSSNHNLTLVV